MTVKEYISVQNVTTPLGTQIDAPLTTAIDLGWCVLNSVYVRIPPGHGGLTGWSLEVNGSKIIPWQQDNTYLVGDDEAVNELLDLELDTGLTIVTYNLSSLFNHTHYARFNYTPIANVATTPAQITLLSLD